MLHGCTQNPDDFATGTRMNVLAAAQDCCVLYPAQSAAANASLCWNWFNSPDQQRQGGEAAIIAGLTAEIMSRYAIDPSRVFVAGMSAGGAMAAILGAIYPDVYSAIGVHSGVPYAAAQNLFTALAAMRRGAEDYVLKSVGRLRCIVFHGDRDRRVHPRNGEQIITQMLGTAANSEQAAIVSVQSDLSNGRAFDRMVYRDVDGRSLAERWVVHGAEHAWSGGDATGSHVDPKGPDASREMLRFFLGLPESVASPKASGAGAVRRALRALRLLPPKAS